MLKHNKKHRRLFADRARVAVFLAIALLLTVGVAFPQSKQSAVQAATCTTIEQCSDQIAVAENKISDLQSEALSFQDAIDTLNSQITQVQKRIDRNVARQLDLERQIAEKQAEIDRQREVLGSLLKSMYVDDQISTIEMLATSKNLSDYVDKEEYRVAVQSQIQNTLVEIAALQQKLGQQKTQVERLVTEETAQRNELATTRAKQKELLNFNQSQQASFNKKTAANKAKLRELIAAQLAANQSSSPGGYYFIRFPGTVKSHNYNVNDYPYRNSGFSMSTLPGCGHPDPYTGSRDSYDRWGYCTRQCVSYTAWAVERSGRSVPMYYGSAKYWINAAQNQGIPVYSTPKVGDVAISTAGTWGHAMYVEAVSGNQIFVSQYNQQLTGQYSTQWRTYR